MSKVLNNENFTKNNENKDLLKSVRARTVKKYFAQFKSPFVILLCVWIAVGCISYLLALYWGLMSSLKEVLNYMEDLFGFPRRLAWENYATAFENLFVSIPTDDGRRRVVFLELLYNSVLFSVVASTVPVVSQMLVAYAATKYNFAFNKVLHFSVVMVIVVPPIGSLGTTLQLYRLLRIYDNFFMLMVARISFAGSGFLVWSGVWRGISSEYMDAAKIDGAGHFRILTTIMLPLARVTFTIMWVLCFITNWNSYSMQYTLLPSMPNLSLALWSFQFDVGNAISWPPIQIAAAMVVSLPCLILYISFQELLVGNLTSGGLKG